MNTRVTVQDIADALGISRNTASKALNNSEGIAEETRARVLNKAIEMGYKQFAYAKSIGGQTPFDPLSPAADQPREISMLTRSKWDGRHFAALMLDAFVREITQMGYTFGSYYVDDEHAEAFKLPDELDISKTAAIMCIEMFDFAYDEMVCSLSIPVLFVDCPARVSGNVLPADLLLMDNATAITHVVSEYILRGIETIGYVGDALHCQSFLERYAAVGSAMNLQGRTFDHNHYIGYNYPDEIDGAITEMLSTNNLPELFVCANDFIAVHVLSCLRKHRIRVPDDVMLIGFDDAPLSRTCVPTLTTVHIHTQVMAFSAAQLIITRLREPYLDFRSVYTQTDLIVRGSSSIR